MGHRSEKRTEEKTQNNTKGEKNKNWEAAAIKFVKLSMWQPQIEDKFWICIISW